MSGGHIYKNELKTEFENPFILEMLSFESMFYMITNWHKINWNNYKLIKDKNWNFSVVIEDKIIIIMYIIDLKKLLQHLLK